MTKSNIIEIKSIKLNINHNNISNELKEFFYNKKYEWREIKILEKVLSENDRILELGAGIGFLSAFCAKKVDNNNIVAYEANPQMINIVKETYHLNSVNPTIKNLILADKEGEVDFYLENNFWSSSTIKRSENSQIIKVKTVNINEEIKKYNPNFIIMDIEGGEAELMPIMNFKNINKLLIEFHPDIIGEKVVSNLIKLLIEKDFCLDLVKTEKNVCYFYKISDKYNDSF
jgi:FkbM family methyltransferase